MAEPYALMGFSVSSRSRRRSSLQPQMLLSQLADGREERTKRNVLKPVTEEGGRMRKRRQSLADSQAQHVAILAAGYTGARKAARRMRLDPASLDNRPKWGAGKAKRKIKL